MAHYIAEHLNAGDLTQRVTLQAPVYNDSGDEITGYSDVVTTWASVEPIRGRELVESERDVSEHWTRVRIRYRPGVDTIKRLIHGTTEYDVESVIDVMSSHKVLEILCRTVK